MRTKFKIILCIIPVTFLMFLPQLALPQVTISSGTTVAISSSVELKDIGLSNSGTITQTAGTVLISGSANSTIGGTGTTTTFNNITINKTTNTVGLILDNNITVNGTLTLTSGDLDVYNKTLTLGSSATISGESNNNLIFSTSANGSRGTVTTSREFSAKLEGQTFGNIGITLSTGISPGATVVTRKFDAVIYETNTGMYKQFVISPAVTSGLNAILVTTYFANELSAGLNPANMILYYSTNSGANWTNAASSNSYNEGTHSGTLTLTGIAALSDALYWSASDNDHPLPVTLASLTGKLNNRDIELNWVTSQEYNNEGFEVQRCISGNQGQSEWKKTGYIKGNGTKSEPSEYTFKDVKCNSGKYKYRLKQIDYNGNFEYFEFENTIEVALPTKYDLGQNYPNPFNPSTKIAFELPEAARVSIILYDMLGREVKRILNEDKDGGYYVIDFNAGDLSSGVYFYRMISGKYVKTLKMSLVK